MLNSPSNNGMQKEVQDTTGYEHISLCELLEIWARQRNDMIDLHMEMQKMQKVMGQIEHELATKVAETTQFGVR